MPDHSIDPQLKSFCDDAAKSTGQGAILGQNAAAKRMGQLFHATRQDVYGLHVPGTSQTVNAANDAIQKAQKDLAAQEAASNAATKAIEQYHLSLQKYLTRKSAIQERHTQLSAELNNAMSGGSGRSAAAIQKDIADNAAEQKKNAAAFNAAQPGIRGQVTAPLPVVTMQPGVPWGPLTAPPNQQPTPTPTPSVPDQQQTPTTPYPVTPAPTPSSPNNTPGTTSPSPSSTTSPDKTTTPSTTTPTQNQSAKDILAGAIPLSTVTTTTTPTGQQGTTLQGTQQQQQQPVYGVSPTGTPGTYNNTTAKPLSDDDFNKLLQKSLSGNRTTTPTTTTPNTLTPANNNTTTLKATPTGLVQPPSWINASTTGTTESAGSPLKNTSTTTTPAGLSGTRTTSSMPMMPMSPMMGGAGAGNGQQAERPKIRSTDDSLYGDDLKDKIAPPILRPRDTNT